MRWTRRLAVITLLVLGGAGANLSPAAPLPIGFEARQKQREAATLVRGLGEADVSWDGQYIGIVAHLRSERAKRLAAIGEPAIPALIHALGNERQYASAHAILTDISRVQHTFVPYNGLRVNFTADGKRVFYPDDRPVLARRWQRWYAARPRPRALPE
jgi:hypothetical protein